MVGATQTTYGGTLKSGSWTNTFPVSGTLHGAAIVLVQSKACGDPPSYSTVTVKAKAKSKTPNDSETTPWESNTKNTSGQVCDGTSARASYSSADNWSWSGYSKAKINYKQLHNA